MPLYTKTGDKGKTSLFSGERVTKDCILLKAVGEIDELNASLGVVVAELKRLNKFFQLTEFTQTTQMNLFKIGSELTSLQTDLAEKGVIQLIGVLHIKTLEKVMDRITGMMPELKNFIVPSGCLAGAYLHQSRTICRRAERALVKLGKEKDLRPELYMYLNRLSDFLFTMSRWVNYKMGESETLVKTKSHKI